MARPIVTKFGMCFRDQVAVHIAQVMGAVHMHVHTRARADARVHTFRCPLLRISETAGRISLKFGMWLETHTSGFLQKLGVGTAARATRKHPFFLSRKRLDGFR